MSKLEEKRNAAKELCTFLPDQEYLFILDSLILFPEPSVNQDSTGRKRPAYRSAIHGIFSHPVTGRGTRERWETELANGVSVEQVTKNFGPFSSLVTELQMDGSNVLSYFKALRLKADQIPPPSSSDPFSQRPRRLLPHPANPLTNDPPNSSLATSPTSFASGSNPPGTELASQQHDP